MVLDGKLVDDLSFSVCVAADSLSNARIELLQLVYYSGSCGTFLRQRLEGIHHLGLGAIDDYDEVIPRPVSRAPRLRRKARLGKGHAFAMFGSRTDLASLPK
jgi:hypothetical protein